MNENTKAVLAIGFDIVIWAVVAWLMFAPRDAASKAKRYWHIAQGCQQIATWFGSMAIEAELRYYAEVKL